MLETQQELTSDSKFCSAAVFSQAGLSEHALSSVMPCGSCQQKDCFSNGLCSGTMSGTKGRANTPTSQ